MKSILWRLAVLTLVAYAPLPAQTARDTAHKATCDDRMAAALRTEALRNNVRKGVVRAVADTLTRCGVALVAPTTQPPPVNQPPVAAFTLACDNATRLCRVTNQSTDPEAGTLTYRTTWGDGSVSTALNPSHTYAATGSYTVALTATDPMGLTATMTRVATLTAPAPTNTAPVAQFTVSCVDLTRVCAVNGSASTDDKGVTGYAWVFGDGATASGVTASHTYALPGAYTIRLTARDLEGLTATKDTTVAFAPPVIDTIVPPPDTSTVAELPRAVPTFTFPAPTRTRAVSPPMDLQAALNATLPGDEIVLSGSFTGEFRYPVVCDPTKWVTIRSASFPAEGVRARPSTSTGYAKLIAPTTYPAAAFSVIGPSCNLRLLGIEIAHTPSPTAPVFLNYGLVLIGDGGWVGGGEQQTTLARVPRNIVIDRSYIHGTPTSELVRCISLNGANAAVINSWVDDCHASGFDSQAIESWNSPGPFLIENNTLIAAGENVMFGGADPGIFGLVPMDITIRRNHFYKPLSWRTSTPRWSVKNLFELKNAGRVLFESNVLENSWPASQEGMAIVIKSSHDSCGTCVWQGTQDLTIRYNLVRYAAVGINLQAVDGESDRHVARVRVEHNLIHTIGPEGRSALMMFTHDLKNVRVCRNTMVHAPGSSGLVMPMAYSFGTARSVTLCDNLLTLSAGYAFHNSDNGSVHTNALRAFANDGSFVVTGNVFAGMAPDFVSQNPPNNLYPSSVTALGLLADYSLPVGSPYTGKGADVPEIQRRTAGVVVAP